MDHHREKDKNLDTDQKAKESQNRSNPNHEPLRSFFENDRTADRFEKIQKRFQHFWRFFIYFSDILLIFGRRRCLWDILSINWRFLGYFGDYSSKISDFWRFFRVILSNFGEFFKKLRLFSGLFYLGDFFGNLGWFVDLFMRFFGNNGYFSIPGDFWNVLSIFPNFSDFPRWVSFQIGTKWR